MTVGLRTLQDHVAKQAAPTAKISEVRSAPTADIDNVPSLINHVREFESRFESFKETTDHSITAIREEMHRLNSLPQPKVAGLAPVPDTALSQPQPVESGDLEEVDIRTAKATTTIAIVGGREREAAAAATSDDVEEAAPVPQRQPVDIDAIVRQLREEINVEEMRATFAQCRRECAETA
jgi:hypothetical protein